MPAQNQNSPQNRTFTVSIADTVDSNGNPALPANGVPVWASPDPSITIAPAPDGMSAVVSVGNKPGVFNCTITGQTMPSGPNFTTVFTVTVAKALAAGFVLTFTNPQ